MSNNLSTLHRFAQLAGGVLVHHRDKPRIHIFAPRTCMMWNDHKGASCTNKAVVAVGTPVLEGNGLFVQYMCKGHALAHGRATCSNAQYAAFYYGEVRCSLHEHTLREHEANIRNNGTCDHDVHGV